MNADYAVRVSKFLEAYEKTPAPAAGDGEYGFKGYQVRTVAQPNVSHEPQSLRRFLLCRHFVLEKCLVNVGASPLDTLADE